LLSLTDGGVYDNLGLNVLDVNRDEHYTPHVYDVDYVIACDAGTGLLLPAIPHIWPTRMARAFRIVHGRAQHGERGRLFAAARNGEMKGFVHACLGMQDARLPMPIADLVPCEAVATYSTNFAAMTADDLDALATRGEQLMRLLLPTHCATL
jgi:NTE family protein